MRVLERADPTSPCHAYPSELVLSANGIQLNSLSVPGLSHLRPILATISLFSQTKPPWGPTWRKAVWRVPCRRWYIRSCWLLGAPSPARLQHHCELELVYAFMWLWRTEKQRRMDTGQIAAELSLHRKLKLGIRAW